MSEPPIPPLVRQEFERVAGEAAGLRVVLVHVEELCAIWRKIAKSAREADRLKEADVWDYCASNLEERVNLGDYLREREAP